MGGLRMEVPRGSGFAKQLMFEKHCYNVLRPIMNIVDFTKITNGPFLHLPMILGPVAQHSEGLDTAVVQDPGAWYVRACPGVKRAFEEVWETPVPCQSEEICLNGLNML